MSAKRTLLPAAGLLFMCGVIYLMARHDRLVASATPNVETTVKIWRCQGAASNERACRPYTTQPSGPCRRVAILIRSATTTHLPSSYKNCILGIRYLPPECVSCVARLLISTVPFPAIRWTRPTGWG